MAHPSPWSAMPALWNTRSRERPAPAAGRWPHRVLTRRNRCRTYRRSVCEFCRRYLHVIAGLDARAVPDVDEMTALRWIFGRGEQGYAKLLSNFAGI